MVLEESILIVDDNQKKRAVWSESIKKLGYLVDHANSPNAARKLFRDYDYGLVLIDLNKNGQIDGIGLLDWIKNHHANTDVIVITTYATLNSSLDALRKGAYDYLVAPVNFGEVASRVKRCMSERRECAERLEMIDHIETMLNQLKSQLVPDGDHSLDSEEGLEAQNIVVDRRKRLVVNEGKTVQLSPTEFEMLDYLSSNADRVVSASELIRAVQGYDLDEMDARPIVRVNIRRLRQKIEKDTSEPNHILTVRSRGYRFAG